MLLLWPGAAAVAAPAGNGGAPVLAAAAPAISDDAEAVLVQLTPDGDAAALPAVPGAGQPAATGVPGLYRIVVPGGDVAPVVAALSQAPGVDYAEADGQMHAAQVEPDDPRWDEQWAKTKIGAPEAWEVTTGSSAVTVAVLDTGVADHPELEGRLLPGWDVVDDTEHSGDVGTGNVASHGTAVAGALAARGDNGVGIAGMCWECRVLPVRVLDATGGGTFSDIVEGIRFAVDNGADIINMSFGSQTKSQAVEDAVRSAADSGVVIVASAGNYNSIGETWPAAMEQVIGVASSTEGDTRSSFSSHGEWADVAAPECIVGLDRFGGVTDEEVCGTSFSTPLVSGILALVLANEPASTPAQLKAGLFDATVDVGTWVAQGRVDAAGALTEPMPSPTPSPTPTASTACSSDEVPPAGFPDVAGNVHRAAIDCAAWYGIAEGLADGTYGPAVTVRRDQMASMLARMLVAEGVALPAGTTAPFSDTGGNVHRTAINQLAQLDVVRGRTPTSFAPAEPVRRDQMASFVARAHRVATGNALPAGGAQFHDIAGNVHRTNIEALAAADVVAGVGFGRYAPAAAVRRDQLATFTTRHLELLAAEGHALQR